MSLFGEIHAGIEAEGLQKVLLAAIESENLYVIRFCKDYVYPLYSNAVGKSWSTKLTESEEHKKIEMKFESKNL